MDTLIKNSTLLGYAVEFDTKAKGILEQRPEWVTGDPIERAIEYAGLAHYFRQLARS